MNTIYLQDTFTIKHDNNNQTSIPNLCFSGFCITTTAWKSIGSSHRQLPGSFSIPVSPLSVCQSDLLLVPGPMRETHRVALNTGRHLLPGPCNENNIFSYVFMILFWSNWNVKCLPYIMSAILWSKVKINYTYFGMVMVFTLYLASCMALNLGAAFRIVDI